MTDFEAQVAAFRERLTAAGLSRVSDSLVQLARPSVRLLAEPGLPAGSAASRLGGLPDLPSSTEWPRNEHGRMSFVAQVDLADVAPYDSEGVLPLDGVLSFFYEAIIQRAWGFDPGDRGSAAVIYTPAGAGAERREAPADLATDGVFKAAGLRPEPELTFAPWDSSDIERLDLGRDEGVAYDELLEELLEIDDGKTNRLLGHPDPIQGDMQLKCQLVTNGLYCGNSSGYHDPRAEELLDGATQWRLLLQVDSQREAGMMWGDLGRLYYWIKQQDLENGAWEESWLILQCG